MHQTPKPPAGARRPGRGRAAREARIRRRFVVGLLASTGAHAALFALPAIEIPLFSDVRADRRVVTHRPSPAAPRPIEVVRIVEIRPPGPASASAGASAAPAAGSGAATAAVRSPSPSRPAHLPPAMQLALAPVSDTAGAPPSLGPPARGVYQRRAGTGSRGAGGRAGGTHGSGLGLGNGSSGVTIIGPGGDCISPGAVPRTGTVGLPGLRRPAGGPRRPGGR